MKAGFAIGRLIYGGFFLYSGINHFLKRQALAQYAAAKQVPSPEAAVVGSGAALAFGGANLMLGLNPRLGAAAIAGFLATATPMMHDFWNAADPNQRQNEMIHFSKNIALLGAAAAFLSCDRDRRI